MAKVDAKRQINGIYGNIWLDNELLAEIDSFEAKVTVNYEDVNMAGDGATHKKLMGWNGEGTITLKKMYTRGASLIAEGLKEGKTLTFKIIGKLADPDAYGAERVAIKEVTFNEFTLMAFEQKSLATEELPFSFADYDLIDTINA